MTKFSQFANNLKRKKTVINSLYTLYQKGNVSFDSFVQNINYMRQVSTDESKLTNLHKLDKGVDNGYILTTIDKANAVEPDVFKEWIDAAVEGLLLEQNEDIKID